MTNLFAQLQAESQRQKQSLDSPVKKQKLKSPTREITPKPTQPREKSREIPRDRSRQKSRENQREQPRISLSRDEIQEFSFRLRDDLKVKVQAEVPHQWQTELEEMARTLNVKKLELYRFMIGEFLGKVGRKGSDHQGGEEKAK